MLHLADFLHNVPLAVLPPEDLAPLVDRVRGKQGDHLGLLAGVDTVGAGPAAIGADLLRAEARREATDAGRVSCARPFETENRACALWREHARRTGAADSLDRAERCADSLARSAVGEDQIARAAMAKAERLADTVLSLPIGPHMSDESADRVIEALRRTTPKTTIEILTPDFRGKMRRAVEMICEAGPDVYNHNLETVPRLYPTIRPGARYYASLRLLESVKRRDPSIFTKSGIMLGLGEERMEVHQVMDDMRSADIDFMTMGQYLQPTPKHAKVIDFVTPQAFDAYAQIARAKGFLQVASSPLTRSSYHAGDDFERMRAAREAQLARSSID